MKEAIQGPARRGMAEEEHPAAVPITREIMQEVADPPYDILVAFSVWIGLIHVANTLRMTPWDRRSSERAVVALPETRIPDECDLRVPQRDFGCFDGPPEVGYERHANPVVPAASAELPCLPVPRRRQFSVKPAGRDAGLIICRCRVGFVDYSNRDGLRP